MRKGLSTLPLTARNLRSIRGKTPETVIGMETTKKNIDLLFLRTETQQINLKFQCHLATSIKFCQTQLCHLPDVVTPEIIRNTNSLNQPKNPQRLIVGQTELLI
ncbi:unnamed protein product [Leptidea sinapis]|uniref:Uncharacterized protein n=1 Tax=Leptidea sinapis TaxID=189913 RepID=A0A5E4Q5C6_9NEOP|nr:unnamed protein product [Leptidea sinapis]